MAHGPTKMFLNRNSLQVAKWSKGNMINQLMKQTDNYKQTDNSKVVFATEINLTSSLSGAGAVRDQGGPGQIRDIVRVQSPNRSRSMIVVGIVNDSIVVSYVDKI